MLHLLKKIVPRWTATTEAYDIYFEPYPGRAIAEAEAENDNAWPEDPDQVPDWVIRAEALRRSIGITDPLPARTRREYWQQVDLCEITAAGKVAPEPEKALPLSTSEAARRFLASIQHDEEVGEYTAHELSALYSDFCDRHGLTPSPVDHVKAELALLPGVRREQISKRDPITNRRQRNWMWIIKPLVDMREEDIAHNYVDPEDIAMAA